MRTIKTILVAATLLLAGSNAHGFGENCPDIPGNITLNFDSVEIKTVLAIFADHAKLTPRIDQSITAVGPVKYECGQWRAVAQELANKYRLNMRVENGTLYVTRK